MKAQVTSLGDLSTLKLGADMTSRFDGTGVARSL